MSGASAASFLSMASLGSSVFGAVSGGLGSFYGAKGQKSTLNFQSNMARINADIATNNADTIDAVGNASADALRSTGEFNAKMAELGAQSALEAGFQQIAAQTLKTGQIKGAQRAAFSANGVDLGEGSAAEVQASSALLSQMDTDTLRANATRSAWGYRAQGLEAKMQADNQALNTRAQAKMQSSNMRMGAVGMGLDAAMKKISADGINPWMAAASSLLSSAGGVSGAWQQFAKIGK